MAANFIPELDALNELQIEDKTRNFPKGIPINPRAPRKYLMHTIKLNYPMLKRFIMIIMVG